MPENIDILNQMIDACKNALITSLQANDRYATGQTIQELQEVVTDKYAALLAPFWIDALENGRPPTPPGTPAGDPTLREAIIPWLSVRGIPEAAAFAIAKKIHKYGYPGKPGVLSVPLGDDSMENILTKGINQLGDNAQRDIMELFDVFDDI